MSGFKDLAKGGWHPKGKDGGKESWRGDFKGINQIAGRFGRGNDGGSSNIDAAKSHVSAPLSSLKDPSLFGPPPKNVSFHGGAALPNQITPDSKGWGASQNTAQPIQQAQPQALVRSTPQPSVPARPTPQPAPHPRAVPQPPAPSQLVLQPQIRSRDQVEQQEVEEVDEEEPSQPRPYAANTTGLSTQGFAKPPMRHTELPQEEPPRLPRYQQSTSRASQSVKPVPGPKSLPTPLSRQAVVSPPVAKPQPPPRLPPRQNSLPTEFTPAPPPAYTPSLDPVATQSTDYINQGAASRLGKAGVSVAGFNIGSNTAGSTPTSAPRQTTGQLGQLQSRFARFNTSSSTPAPTTSSTAPSPAAAGGGTTWAQKQKALQTASAFHKDPTSVSFKDARQAASTANNFNQRHGAQVAAGFSVAQKFGASASGAISRIDIGSQGHTAPSHTAPAVEDPPALIAAKKKPPPPPKKKEFLADVTVAGEPPPIPLASKPRSWKAVRT